jgi:hypothetical protein
MEEVIDDFIGGFWKNDRVIEMQQLASEHHWEFVQRERFSEQPTAIKGFRVFDGKRGKRLTGLMHINTGLHHTARIYDYVYYSDGGKKKTTIIEIVSPELHLPRFQIKPKSGLSSVFSWGRKKSSAVEQFTSAYQLETPEPEAVDIYIPDSVLGLVGKTQKLSLEGDGRILLYYYYRKQIPVLEIPAEYNKALEIMDRLLHDRQKEFV